MTEQRLQSSTDPSGIARITLDRPELHNAFDDALIGALTSELLRADADDTVRVVVLAANGKSFSAGGDLNWMRRMADFSRDDNIADAMALARLMRTLDELRKPVVGLVQGSAFGGGVGLVACCDIAIAAEGVEFCLSEVKLGLIPAVISPYVVRAIGSRAARRFFLTAERFDAAEAQRLGLIHMVVSPGDLEEAGAGFAKALLKGGPEALAAAKVLIRRVADRPTDERVIEYTAHAIADMRASQEGREGVAAFLEKRRPHWIGN